ncbi:MAG: cytochrome [Modestobacter sp.]|jgi:cytochrome P450|nr:cytochrome [Modestobacter sp.]
MTTTPVDRSPRTAVRWAVTQGLPARYLDRAAREGDLLARLLRDPGCREDPHPLYEQIRARGPLSDSSLGLVTASHAVATEVLRSEAFGVGWDRSTAPRWVRWVLRATDDPAASGVTEPPSMLVVDPPDHTRYRRLVSRAFTPRATARFEPAIEAIAGSLLDRLDHSGPVDLVAGYAAPLPVLVIADLLGVPTDRREDFLRWGEAAAVSLDPGLPWRRYAEAAASLREMHRFLAGHVDRLRRDPGDDLVSQLVGRTDDPLTDQELHAVVMLLLGAGFETTVNLLGNAVVALDAHPDQRDGLVRDPSGWDRAVEEVLRHDSPVQLTGRTVRTGTTVAGRALPAGARVTLLLGAANRDPALFADPDRFDATRANARDHLAFSAGIHYCLGAGLARLEAVGALRALAERFPGLRVAGTPERRDLQTLRGFARLPVRLR